MKKFDDALERFREDELEGYDFVKIIRGIGPGAADLLLAEVFTGGEPHEGARENPAWDAWKQSYLVQALGATRSAEVIPWLEFVIHCASDFDCEGNAAEALAEIGTEDSMRALVDGALCSAAKSDDAETMYEVIVEHSDETLPIIEDLVDNSGFAQNRLDTLLEICVSMGGDEWQPAKAWIKDSFWTADDEDDEGDEGDEDEDAESETEDNVIELPSGRNKASGPDGDRVRAYVRKGLDFEISDEVYKAIDHAMGQLWNALPLGGYMHIEDLKDAIRALRSDGILFSEAQMHAVANLILDALEAGEQVEHVSD